MTVLIRRHGGGPRGRLARRTFGPDTKDLDNAAQLDVMIRVDRPGTAATDESPPGMRS